MLALAKGLIDRSLGIIAAARKLRCFEDGVEPEIAGLLRFFVGIHSETDALPLGEERALWNAEALAKEDLKIDAAERLRRDRATIAATRLVRLLEQTS